jgi:putative transposase
LNLALQASGRNQVHVIHRPRLLSDNGSSSISGDLAKWLGEHKIAHIRGAPCHPQTQGKIEPWHQTLKNRIMSGAIATRAGGAFHRHKKLIWASSSLGK